jgi:hypothetical protein
VNARPRPRRVALGVIGAFVALELGYAIWVALIARGRLGPRVGYGPDSILYLTAARAPLWSHRFYAGPGGFGFLLLAKACARNLRAIVLVQSLLAVGAWTFLAATVCGLLRSAAARWVAMLGILGVALAPGVLQWNALITTESLSMSTLCIVLALGLRVAGGGSRRDVGWFIGALAAFAFTRDTNALVVGGLALVAFVCAIRTALRVRGIVIGVAGIAFAFTATSLANAAEPPRWYWPVAETTAVRLLADPGATRYLVAHDFPFDEQMRTLPERYIYIYDPVRTGKEFAAFRHWVRVDGRRVYLGYLLSHPGWALREPFDDRDAFFNSSVIEVYAKVYRNRPGGPFTAIGAVAAPHPAVVTECWSLLAVAALAARLRRRPARRALVGAVAMSGVFAVAGYYAAWHGDALEVYRHALSAAVELRLTLWIVTALTVDAVLTRRDRSAVGVQGETDLDREQDRRAAADENHGDGTDPVAAGGDHGR